MKQILFLITALLLSVSTAKATSLYDSYLGNLNANADSSSISYTTEGSGRCRGKNSPHGLCSCTKSSAEEEAIGKCYGVNRKATRVRTTTRSDVKWYGPYLYYICTAQARARCVKYND